MRITHKDPTLRTVAHEDLRIDVRERDYPELFTIGDALQHPSSLVGR
jgi:hypothetical protein